MSTEFLVSVIPLDGRKATTLSISTRDTVTPNVGSAVMIGRDMSATVQDVSLLPGRHPLVCVRCRPMRPDNKETATQIVRWAKKAGWNVVV